QDVPQEFGVPIETFDEVIHRVKGFGLAPLMEICSYRHSAFLKTRQIIPAAEGGFHQHVSEGAGGDTDAGVRREGERRAGVPVLQFIAVNSDGLNNSLLELG